MVFVSLWLKDARGPYWLWANSDPEYAYLLNSLGICQLLAPGHIDHPGSTLHFLGAVFIKAAHLLWGKGPLAEDVLRNPEQYLNAVSAGLMALNALVLFAAGFTITKMTQSIYPGLLIQSAPFLSATNIEQMPRVTPEPVLLAFAIMYGVLALIFLMRKNDEINRGFIVSFGILTGLIVATKVTAIPLAVIPLILFPRPVDKIRFIIFSVFFFLVTAFPVWVGGHGFTFLLWVYKLTVYTGFYGSGDVGLPDSSRYAADLMTLVVNEKLFAAIVLLSSAVIVWFWKSDNVRQFEFSERLRSGLFALVICELCQFLVVARHPSNRYLVPCLGLLSVNLAVITIMVQKRFKSQLCGGVLFTLTALAIIGTQVGPLLSANKSMREIQSDASRLISELNGTYAGWTKIGWYRSSSPEYAMSFGNYHANDSFTKQLQSMYPNFVSYNIWDGQYYRFGEKVSLQDVILRNSRIILQGTDIPPPYGPVKAFTKILPARNESLFRLHMEQ